MFVPDNIGDVRREGGPWDVCWLGSVTDRSAPCPRVCPVRCSRAPRAPCCPPVPMCHCRAGTAGGLCPSPAPLPAGPHSLIDFHLSAEQMEQESANNGHISDFDSLV